MRPDEPRRPPPNPNGSDAPRRLNAMWTLALRRFRSHLQLINPHTTDEDPDGRTR